AVSLHEGFNYNPSQDNFWKQSKANENSYLFVTTRHLNEDYLNMIAQDLRENEYLVIACVSFEAHLDKKNKNIKIKKIPQMLLNKCEYNLDNYNLNIIHPPELDIEE